MILLYSNKIFYIAMLSAQAAPSVGEVLQIECSGGNVNQGLKFGLLLCLTAACSNDKQAIGQGPTADLIIHNAKILTVDDDFSTAEALAVKDGKFMAVGLDAEALKAAGADTRVIDLHGLTVLPGFNDVHSHPVQMGLNLPATIDLTEVQSIADIQAVVAKKVSESQPGEWIFSEGGWWQFTLAEDRLPNRRDLDPVSPDNPVILRGGHYFIVNTVALEKIGYDRDTQDPPGGEIWRDEKGEPTGFLLDAAHEPTHRYFPELTRAQRLDGLRQALRRVNSWGITSLREAGGTREQVALLKELYRADDLTVRIDWAYDVDPNTPAAELDTVLDALGEPGQSWGDGMFRADSLAETFLDGAEESALLRNPYRGRPDYYGQRLVTQDQLNMFAVKVVRRGWRMSPHAVGDAAIDQALEAFEHVTGSVPILDRRWMIDHAILMQPDQYPRVKQLGLIVNAQPRHLYIIGDKFIEYWGAAVADQSYRFRDWIDNGLTVTLGADRPISSRSSPLMQVAIAVTRETGWGGVLGESEAISREEAIRAITATPALTSFEEGVKGTIEPGKYADFVVLSNDILEVPADGIKDIRVVATVLGGELVYGTLN